MAREIIERLVDDLDGGAAAETVVFGLDGATYEIDLSKKNAAALRTSLARFIGAARHSGPPATKRSRGASPTKPRPSKSPAKASSAPKTKTKAAKASKATREYDVAELRTWAAANGIDVPARGRIPQATVEQYTATLGR